MDQRREPNDCLLVIFGASGDLTKRKLIPSLYDLFCTGQLPERLAVLGLSRTGHDDESFRQYLEPHVKQFAQHFAPERWAQFARRVHYLASDATKLEAFPQIEQRLDELQQAHGTGQNLLFYLSVAPKLYEPIISNIGHRELVTEGKRWCSLNEEARPWQRIVVEKPFGHDASSAAHLNRVLGRVFEDEDVFRIDHYLGKETVQNLMVFRFANAIFEPIWSRQYIDHVQITAAETVGVEGRGSYYDGPQGGAMRDMIQSHLLQLMALVAMEPPVQFRAADIRAETTKVLNAAYQPRPEDVANMAVRGQYTAGEIHGDPVPGFGEEPGISPDSRTETYAALKVMIGTWRWQGVPFYLRSGKRLRGKTTEVVVNFRPTPHRLFGEGRGQSVRENQIVMNLQPNEGIRLRLDGKVPGTGMQIGQVVMDFDYAKQFQAEAPDAYATLLLEVMRGDQTLFKQREELEQAWRLVDPVLAYWQTHDRGRIPKYSAGTWGPPEADQLLEAEGRGWHTPALRASEPWPEGVDMR
jgi:glucose-6-phosphate 1-dehydrogenase